MPGLAHGAIPVSVSIVGAVSVLPHILLATSVFTCSGGGQFRAADSFPSPTSLSLSL